MGTNEIGIIRSSVVVICLCSSQFLYSSGDISYTFSVQLRLGLGSVITAVIIVSNN